MLYRITAKQSPVRLSKLIVCLHRVDATILVHIQRRRIAFAYLDKRFVLIRGELLFCFVNLSAKSILYKHRESLSGLDCATANRFSHVTAGREIDYFSAKGLKYIVYH
jgi:hypothetical protein